MRVFLFGLGGIGSNIAHNLAYDKKDCKFVLIDKDVVELRNIQAGTQFYFKEQMGMEKTKALRLNLYKNAGIDATRLTKEIKNIVDVQEIVDMHPGIDNLVVDAFDNVDARKILYEFGERTRVPVLHIGFSGQKTYEITWNERYQVPKTNVTKDICTMSGARSFILYVSGIASSVIQHYIDTGNKINLIGNKFTIIEI